MKYTDAVHAEKNGTLMKLDGNDNFVVCEPFVWFVDYEEKTGKILVPTGFITDLGSIPPVFPCVFFPQWFDRVYSSRLYVPSRRKNPARKWIARTLAQTRRPHNVPSVTRGRYRRCIRIFSNIWAFALVDGMRGVQNAKNNS